MGDHMWCSYSGMTSTVDWPFQRFAEYACGMVAAYIHLQSPADFSPALVELKKNWTTVVVWNVALMAGVIGAVYYLSIYSISQDALDTNSWMKWGESETMYTIFGSLLALIMITALDSDLGVFWGRILGADFFYPLASLSYTGYLWSLASGKYTLYILTYFAVGYNSAFEDDMMGDDFFNSTDDDSATPNPTALEAKMGQRLLSKNSLGAAGWLLAYGIDMIVCCAMAFILSALVE